MFKRYVYMEGLTNLLDSNGEFSINILGNVKDRFGEAIPVKEDGEGYQVANVLSWDGRRDYRVIDLVAIHFKDLYIPKENYNDVVAFVIDGDKKNNHANNVGYRFKKKIESLKNKGFFHIPGYTNYAINESGIVFNTSTGNFLTWSKTNPIPERNIKGGYFRIAYNSKSFQRVINCSRHRAICLTFKEYPDNVDSMTVNHRNGIPGDDRPDNLEWATRGQNNTHAYVNDLKNQHMRVLCRDVLTGEVIEYYSISECARALGFSTDEAIRFRLYRTEFCKVFSDGKQLKLKSDERDWIIPDDPQKAIEEARKNIAIVVRDCATLEEKTYLAVNHASKEISIENSTIKWRLDRGDKSPLFGYQFKRLDDLEPFPVFTEDEYRRSLIPISFAVDARNLLTGESREYMSINQASKELDRHYLSTRLKEGNQPLYEDGWQLKLKHQEWVDVPDFEKAIYEMTKDITARCEKTGDLLIASSAAQMAEILKKDPKSIRKAAMTRGNLVYHGYRFRLGFSDEPWPV